MLEELADDILFWFTETIMLLPFAYIERILRNKMCPLSIHASRSTNDMLKG